MLGDDKYRERYMSHITQILIFDPRLNMSVLYLFFFFVIINRGLYEFSINDFANPNIPYNFIQWYNGKIININYVTNRRVVNFTILFLFVFFISRQFFRKRLKGTIVNIEKCSNIVYHWNIVEYSKILWNFKLLSLHLPSCTVKKNIKKHSFYYLLF